MGSDQNHFNLSLTVRDKVTRQCPQTTTLFEEKGRAEAESNRGPSAYQPVLTRLTAGPNRLTISVQARYTPLPDMVQAPCGTCGSLSRLAKAEDVTLVVVTSRGVAGKGWVTLRAAVCHF